MRTTRQTVAPTAAAPAEGPPSPLDTPPRARSGVLTLTLNPNINPHPHPNRPPPPSSPQLVQLRRARVNRNPNPSPNPHPDPNPNPHPHPHQVSDPEIRQAEEAPDRSLLSSAVTSSAPDLQSLPGEPSDAPVDGLSRQDSGLSAVLAEGIEEGSTDSPAGASKGL